MKSTSSHNRYQPKGIILVSRDLLSEKVEALISHKDSASLESYRASAILMLLECIPSSWAERLKGIDLSPFRTKNLLGRHYFTPLQDHDLDKNVYTKRNVEERIGKANLPNEDHYLGLLNDVVAIGWQTHKVRCPGFLMWEKNTPFELRIGGGESSRWRDTFAGLGNICQSLKFPRPSQVSELLEGIPIFEMRVTELSFVQSSTCTVQEVTQFLEGEMTATLESLSSHLTERDFLYHEEIPIHIRIVVEDRVQCSNEIAYGLAQRMMERGECEDTWFTSVTAVLQERLDYSLPSPSVKRRDELEPGDEYLVLQCELDSFQLGGDGKFYAKYAFDESQDLQNSVGMSVQQLLESFGVTSSDLHSITSRLELDEFVASKVEFSEFSYEFPSPEDAEDFLERALYCRGLPSASSTIPTHVLRLVVDVATSAQFASIEERTRGFDQFLTLATSPGEQALGVLPKKLKVPKSLSTAHPLIGRWAALNSLAIIHPASGGDAGVHHIRQWRADLESLWRGGDSFWWLNRGVSIDEIAAWVRVHNGVLAGDLDYSSSHYTGVKVVDTARFRGWRDGLLKR